MTVHKEKPCHRSNYTAGRTEPVEYLVVHYVAAAGRLTEEEKIQILGE